MSRTFSMVALLAGAALMASMAWAAAPAPSNNPAGGGARVAPGPDNAGAGAPGARGGRGGRGARGGGGGGGPASSILDQVAIQTGQNPEKSRTAHEHLLTKAKIGKAKIDVYVQGDSIMRRWGCDPEVEKNYAKYYEVWKDVFWGYNAGDFAWGADTIQNILWRLRNGELDDLNPKVTIFMGGTNNVNPNANVDDLTKGLTACFEEIRKKAPDTTLVIIGILPRMPAGDIPVIDKINANIAKLADGKKTRFIDLKSKMLKEDGTLVPGMLNSDNLHPDTEGYKVIGEAIKPILKEVLGPPAKEDHAPPPTWDPSAAGAPATYPKPTN